MAQANKSAAQILLDRRRSDKASSGGKKEFENNINFFALPKEECEVVLRFLPPVAGQDLPGFMEKLHYKIPLEGKGEQKIKSMIDQLGLEKDPMEQVLKKYRKLLDVTDQEMAIKLYFNVLVKSIKVRGKTVTYDAYNKKDYDFTKPMVLSMYGDFTYFWLLERLVDAELGDVTDPKDGYWYKFVRARDGSKWDREVVPYNREAYNTPFGTAIAKTDDGINEILSQMTDFTKIFKAPDDSYLVKARKAADACEKMFAERLKAEEARERDLSGTHEVVKSSEPLTTEKIPFEPDVVTEKEVKAAAVAAPSGAPSCFGDKTKLYAGYPSEDEAEKATLNADQTAQFSKCMSCPFELICSSKSYS